MTAQLLTFMPLAPQAFVYNPALLTGTAKTAAIKTFGSAGSSSSRMAAQFPALSGFGLAQTCASDTGIFCLNLVVWLGTRLSALSTSAC